MPSIIWAAALVVAAKEIGYRYLRGQFWRRIPMEFSSPYITNEFVIIAPAGDQRYLTVHIMWQYYGDFQV